MTALIGTSAGNAQLTVWSQTGACSGVRYYTYILPPFCFLWNSNRLITAIESTYITNTISSTRKIPFFRGFLFPAVYIIK